MKKILILTLCALLAVSMFCGCAGGKDGSDTGEASDVQSTDGAPVSDPVSTDEGTGDVTDDTGEPEEEVFVIKTAYADLKFPAKWQDKVTYEVGDDSVSFSSGDVRIFDILFNGGDGYVLGTIIGEKENVVVKVADYLFDSDAENYDELCAMQEDINVIIDHLVKDYDFEVGVEAIKEDDSVFEIETPVATLYYPNKWKESVTIEKDGDSLRFSCGEIKLFDVLFNSDDGFRLGTYNDTTINVVDYEIDEDSFSAEDFERLCAMQEDINVILQYLMKDSNFTLS